MNTRMRALAIGLLAALAAIVTPAHADTPGVNLPLGQYYAIDGCPVVQGRCEWQTLGSGEGSVYIAAGDGETVSTTIGGRIVMYHESPGYTLADGITTVWGRLMVQGSVYTQAAPTIVSDYTVADTDVTVLVDTSAHDVLVTLPSAIYHPGRRVTLKKVASGHTLTIAPESGGVLDGAASAAVSTQWALLTVEGTPDGNGITGWTTNKWSIVGH